VRVKRRYMVLSTLLVVCLLASGCASSAQERLGMAVEFCDHAASAHISKHLGWFEEEGLAFDQYDTYLTGMALASALGKGDIDVAYMCLAPAISAYANGGLPIKIVAGTHRYGYGLLVDPDRVNSVEDLEGAGIKIACPREGSPLDLLLNKLIDQYGLDRDLVLSKVQRMPPAQVLLALEAGRVDMGFCSEQFSTMGEEFGLDLLVAAEDLWPGMQGSVLVVTEELLLNHEDVVETLVEITQRAIEYIEAQPADAAAIVASELQIAGDDVLPLEMDYLSYGLSVTPDVILKSLTNRMECSVQIDEGAVQAQIDYMAQLGYISSSFEAGGILDLRFVAQ
jgi:NitT/TauT family transport system substrate-binding protein